MSNIVVPSFGYVATPDALLSLIKGEAMPNGNLSIRGVARMADVADKSIMRGRKFNSQKLGEMLTANGFSVDVLAQDGFPPLAVAIVLKYFAFDSKVKSTKAYNICAICGIAPSQTKQTRKASVAQVERKLVNKYYRKGDKREVKTSVGRIDLLTSAKYLVEFKSAKSFCHALGQVISYHHVLEDPEYIPAIVLFGKIKQETLLQYANIAFKNGVKLFFDDGTKESFNYNIDAIHTENDFGPWQLSDAVRKSLEYSMTF